LCDVKVTDRFTWNELRARSEIPDDIITVVQQKILIWFWHVLTKDDNDWGEKMHTV